jgi:predicted methyltransferase MtxX (methanogen marker protein 4)
MIYISVIVETKVSIVILVDHVLGNLYNRLIGLVNYGLCAER